MLFRLLLASEPTGNSIVRFVSVEKHWKNYMLLNLTPFGEILNTLCLSLSYLHHVLRQFLNSFNWNSTFTTDGVKKMRRSVGLKCTLLSGCHNFLLIDHPTTIDCHFLLHIILELFLMLRYLQNLIKCNNAFNCTDLVL